MLRPHEMSSVIITGHNNVLETVIQELHELKVLHIVEHSKNQWADIGKPLEEANNLSEMIVKVRALILELKIKRIETTYEFENQVNFSDIELLIKNINDNLSKNLDELKNVEDQISSRISDRSRQELEILKEMDFNVEYFLPYKSLEVFTGYVKNKNDVIFIKEELSKKTDNFLILESSDDIKGINKKKIFFVLFVDTRNKENTGKVLSKYDFSPIKFENIGNLKGSALENLQRMERETTILKNKRKDIKEKITVIGQEHGEFLLAAELYLIEKLEKAEAPLTFATTPTSFLIKGWVPSEILTSSISRLNKITNKKIFIHSEPAKKKQDVPIKLKNPGYVKPFEFFMNLYTLPSYREIDPTFFIFLTFPLLFGFMLGDIGYGLITLVLCMILKKQFPKAKSFFDILIFASLATIFFGFFFGEFFGYEEIAGFSIPHVLSRSHEIDNLLYLAIAIGTIHINLGLIIGFFNELESHGFIHALCAKGGWILLETGVALLVLYWMKIVYLPIYAGIIFLIISLLMLLKGEGVIGCIEVPKIFSNILSYARLMAIGVSSVKLAEVINESAGEMFHSGGLLIIAGILILVIGHVVNIGLGLMGSFLHSLRLHYVEFFSKFFHGGAKKYYPFGIVNYGNRFE